MFLNRFRNSISELELNVDILPPFRDDVRLTVPEYRSKLYEMVQAHGEKSKSTDNNKNSYITIKTREHKSLQNLHDNPSTTKEIFQQNNRKLNAIINKALKKTTPLAKKKNAKTINYITIEDSLNNEPAKYPVKIDRFLQRSKWHEHYQQQLNRQIIGDQLPDTGGTATDVGDTNNKRFDINELNFDNQKTNIAMNKIENDINNKTEHNTPHTTPLMLKNCVHQTKAEVTPFCFEKRLKKLVEEIERYNSEVETFYRETFRNSQQTQQQKQQQSADDNKINCKNYNFKSSPKMLTTTSNCTPIKKIYFQLITKGQRQNYHKSDLDLSGKSGNGSSSSDNFHNSCSCHTKAANSTNDFQCNNNNRYNKLQSHQQQDYLTQQQQHHHHMTQKHQSQQRYRPISKFVQHY